MAIFVCMSFSGFFRLDLLASEGYLNVQRDSLELRFQVRPSTFFQRCRDQQWYINHLLKKQWHHETEIKQLKDRLRREVTKNKHHSTAGGGGSASNTSSTGSGSSNNSSGSNGSSSTNGGTSITEINPPSSSLLPSSSAASMVQPSASAISVGENCQLISVNLANTISSSASTSYSSSSSSSEAANDLAPSSYSGTKSKNHGSAAKYSSSNSSSKKSHSSGGGGGGSSTRSCIKLAKEKPSSHLYDECDIGGGSSSRSNNVPNPLMMRDKQHKDGLPNDGK